MLVKADPSLAFAALGTTEHGEVRRKDAFRACAVAFGMVDHATLLRHLPVPLCATGKDSPRDLSPGKARTILFPTPVAREHPSTREGALEQINPKSGRMIPFFFMRS